MTVILAASIDIPDMVSMVGEMHDESRYSFVPYNPEKMERVIAQLIASPQGYAAIYRRASGEVSGMIMGHVAEYYFSNAKCASDIIVFVRAPFRGTLAGYRMIEAFVAWAQGRGVMEVVFGHSSGTTGIAFGRLMENQGFEMEGTVYKRRVWA